MQTLSPWFWCGLALALLAACGPVPGGSLGGQAAKVPSDWSTAFEGDHTWCEVEARPEDPHSIQLDCFLYERALYANSHRWAQASWWPVTSWAAVWLEHPKVQVRIGESLYPLVATPVTDAAERENDPAPSAATTRSPGIVLFRFDPRS